MAQDSNDTAELDEQRDLTQGSIAKTLAVMTGPTLFGIAAVLSVSLVDTLFAGRLGEDQLAALSFAFPVTTIVSGLALGLATGAASVVARETGEGNTQEARRQSLHAVLLSLMVVSLVSVAGALLADPLFALLGASETTRGMIVGYMRVWFLSMPFLAFVIMSEAISRAVGNALWPSLIMVGSAAVNIGATAVLVFGLLGAPELGLTGAAAGTLVGQMITSVASFWLLTRHVDMVDWHLPKLGKLIPSWLNMTRVAVPAALGNMANPFAIMIVTVILATLSERVVAGFGVAVQVESIATIPMVAMSAGLAAIAGQNWGAGEPQRIVKTLKLAYGLSIAWAVILGIALWFYGERVAGLFDSGGEIASNAALYLRIVPVSLFGFGLVICSAAVFNGIDHAGQGLGFTLVRASALYVPLAWIGSMLADAQGTYIGIAVANAVSGIAVAAYALHWLGKHADAAGETTRPAPERSTRQGYEDGRFQPAE